MSAVLTRKSCEQCRRHRAINGVLRCDEPRSSAVGGVVVLDMAIARSAGNLDRICALVAERCRFYQPAS